MRHHEHKLISCIFILYIMLASCLKDKGNYTYHAVNDPVVVKGVDTLYVVDVIKQSFRIAPVITTPDGKPIDTSRYTYSWQLNQGIGIASDYPSLVPLSTSPTLDIPKDSMVRTITNAQMRHNLFGAYTAFFRVTDKATGLFKDTYFKIVLGSTSAKGWLLLCDPENGNTRLGMISSVYNDTLVPDILASVGSTFPITGQPRFIAVDLQTRFKPQSGRYPFIGTSQHFAILGSDTLEYKNPRYNLANYIAGLPIPPDFSSATFASDGYQHYLQNNGSLYYIDEYYSLPFQACNYLNDVPFRASKFVAPYTVEPDFRGAIVFNEDTRTFLRTPLQAYCLELPQGTLFNFSTKQQLRYMQYVSTFNGGEVFAILDSTSKINLARFSKDGIQSYYREITAPDIHDAGLFAVDNIFGFIFYCAGGKLYEYNMSSRQAQLIHDYGNNKITVLKIFNDNLDIFNNSFSNIVVCTYNEADKKSGTLDLYTTPKVDGTVSLVKSIPNTGKIVDVAYK
ncbi:PKD-like family lipoprotein [Chitinophaga sp. OAE865]|uniref:PKD-like family lipoprotein n=1 Tax=Chitinophaga sp. OAE865 TaxID=2817898 RepID=UPI001AEB9C3C